MKVFISWSGPRSRSVALALRDWLPLVINSVEPFVSSKDIYAGARWQLEIAAHLEASNFGIICVTAEAQHAPWLNFEAGALAKAVEASRVVPLAINLKPSDIELPLGQFQAQPATEAGILELLSSVNAASNVPLTEVLLKKATAKWWPDLQQELDKIGALDQPHERSVGEVRSDRELLEEVLNSVRTLVSSGAAAGRTHFGRVPTDHAVHEQIREVLAAVGEGETRILHASDWRLGIRPSEPLSAHAKSEIERIAGEYNIRIDFLAPRPFTGFGEVNSTAPAVATAVKDESDVPEEGATTPPAARQPSKRAAATRKTRSPRVQKTKDAT